MDCFTATTRCDQLDVNPSSIISCLCLSLPSVAIKPIDISHTIPPLQEYEFPTSFTSAERRYVDHFCTQFGLKTKRRRNGANRWVTAYKPSSTIIAMDSSYGLSDFTQNIIKTLLQRFPASDKEKETSLSSLSCHFSHAEHRLVGNTGAHQQFESQRELNCTTGRLSNIIPQIPIPPPFASGRMDQTIAFRKSLPVWLKRTDVMEAIASNRIVVVSGGTGCGKTTQIPQYILEYCNLMKKSC
ncbi:unnamed protein product, partial [Oppiella nova]